MHEQVDVHGSPTGVLPPLSLFTVAPISPLASSRKFEYTLQKSPRKVCWNGVVCGCVCVSVQRNYFFHIDYNLHTIFACTVYTNWWLPSSTCVLLLVLYSGVTCTVCVCQVTHICTSSSRGWYVTSICLMQCVMLS